MTTAIITQSNYIPWKGYFDQILHADHLILYDTAQFTKRDWRNRNKIKTPQGPQWLTIPVYTKGKFFQEIRETKVQDFSWANRHWETLTQNYRSSPCFNETAPFLEELYKQAGTLELLSEINFLFLDGICKFLGIGIQISWSHNYNLIDGKTARLAQLCSDIEANKYISGPAAKDYLDESEFLSRKIEVSFFEYPEYPKYRQPHGEFSHQVSIVDLLFCEGKQAIKFLCHNREESLTQLGGGSVNE